MRERRILEIARRFADLGETVEALKTYSLAIEQGLQPQEEMEAALYLFQNGGDYRISYTSWRNLYNAGHFKADLLLFMTSAFYEPNVKLLKSRYEKNCKALQKYPYLFRKDFLPFEQLPIRFYPYDDNGYVPFFVKEERFGDYINFKHPVISRNFFADLENPIFAPDVYSQYELEYLNDNVRPSEWVAKENHIYLHYTDWGTFCAHLAVLNLRDLLKDKKLVFLVEEESEQYPIDFKSRFGLDYSQYPVRPVGIREIHRLIWHTQLASHNGGDFFNEVFDGHPNLLVVHSTMTDNVEESMAAVCECLRQGKDFELKHGAMSEEQSRPFFDQLRKLTTPTIKDVFVAFCMSLGDGKSVDPMARIVPAIFYQPHFSNIHYTLHKSAAGVIALDSNQYREIQNSPLMQGFRYLKAFTPIRRPTSSCGASVRFVLQSVEKLNNAESDKAIISLPADNFIDRLLNRSFMVDWQDPLQKDCVLVRFEDGKLNPKATFTALAAFLDLPYTESMTYCSQYGMRDPESMPGNDRGFSPAAVYRNYEEYVGDSERCLLEYALRDLYVHCGYDYQRYDGASLTQEQVETLLQSISALDAQLENAIRSAQVSKMIPGDVSEKVEAEMRQTIDTLTVLKMKQIRDNRLEIMTELQGELRFVNKNGQPLRMMPLLQLDPDLLEQPLYR